jgi:galactokinase
MNQVPSAASKLVTLSDPTAQLDWCGLPSLLSTFNLLIHSQGEHIDYALFGVLPAAIDRDILIACAPRPSECHNEPGRTVVAENLHPKYTRPVFEPVATRSRRNSDSSINEETWSLDINTKELRWESYVKAGYYVRLTPCFAGSVF